MSRHYGRGSFYVSGFLTGTAGKDAPMEALEIVHGPKFYQCEYPQPRSVRPKGGSVG
jgi:hypothetical protein